MNADLMMMMAPFLFALTIAVAALVISRRDEKAYYERKAKGLVGAEGAEEPPRPLTEAQQVRRRIFLGQSAPVAPAGGAAPSRPAAGPEPEARVATEAEPDPVAAPAKARTEEPASEHRGSASEHRRAASEHRATPLALGAGGLTVLRRWTVRPDLEEAFERAWGELTGELRSDHGLDAAWLHRAEDGSYVATERWSSAEAHGRDRTLTHATAAALLEAAGEPVHEPLVLAMRAAAD